MVSVERFPIYRGCNENLDNESLKKCTSDKIRNFLKMSFDFELADKLFPQNKSTSFKVNFIIDKNGKVEKITAQANKREIAVEAINVMKHLPKFKKPGYLRGKPISTPFNVMMTIYF